MNDVRQLSYGMVVLHGWLAWSLSAFFSTCACISCQIDALTAAFQLHQARGVGFEVAILKAHGR